MAFRRFANALVVHPHASQRGWDKVRVAARVAGTPSESLVEQASEILGGRFDPSKYLLSHCTIVASVDVEKVADVKLGSVKEDGKRINRKYADYRITAATDPLINNNFDAFPRFVLLKAYRTFIGAHNFCFAPGTPVTMADGSRKPIEAVVVGDEVLTHLGRARKVTHTFRRDYEGPIRSIHFDRFKEPILATGNHPFAAIDSKALGNPASAMQWVEAERLGGDLHALGPKQGEVSQGEVWNGHLIFGVTSNTESPFTGTVHNLEVEEDHSYVVGQGFAVHNCEHVQVEDLSKGRIIDAVARDIGESIYVDILVATDRKHKELVRDIESGRMGSLSMGCTTETTTCSKCGNVAVDETETCDCVRYSKGNVFMDEAGKRHRVAETCGHPSLDPTGGVTFIEASWVANPAFTGAVMRNILTPEQVSAGAARQAQRVLASPPPQWVDGGQRKAAAGRVGQFDFGDPAPQEEQEPAAPKEPTPLDELEDDVLREVVERVEKRVRDYEKGEPKSPEDSSAARNDNVALEASYRETLDTAVRGARSPAHAAERVARVDASFGRKCDPRVYRAALTAGPMFGSSEKYLQVCRGALGRAFDVSEARALLRVGRILSALGPTAESINDPVPNRSK